MKWIPCKERLPALYLMVLVTMIDDTVEALHLVEENSVKYWTDYHSDYDFDQIKAWMLLPEPYEEEK